MDPTTDLKALARTIGPNDRLLIIGPPGMTAETANRIAAGAVEILGPGRTLILSADLTAVVLTPDQAYANGGIITNPGLNLVGEHVPDTVIPAGGSNGTADPE